MEQILTHKCGVITHKIMNQRQIMMDATTNKDEVGRNPEQKSRTPVLEQEKQNHDNQVCKQGIGERENV
jgi:hypothetical protein